MNHYDIFCILQAIEMSDLSALFLMIFQSLEIAYSPMDIFVTCGPFVCTSVLVNNL